MYTVEPPDECWRQEEKSRKADTDRFIVTDTLTLYNTQHTVVLLDGVHSLYVYFIVII